jgi:hypothetical protein
MNHENVAADPHRFASKVTSSLSILVRVVSCALVDRLLFFWTKAAKEQLNVIGLG